MYNINAKLILDQGNSQERGCVVFTANGQPKKEIFELSNVFATIPDDEEYQVPSTYNADNSTIFSASFKAFSPVVADDDNLEGGYKSEQIDATFVHGALAHREFAQTAFRPSATEKKYLVLNTPLAFIRALLEATRIIAKELGVQNLNDLSITWDVFTLLPPNDVDRGEQIIKDTFLSITQVKFDMPDYLMNVNINSVTVYPEGFCAFMGATFTSDYKIREGYADLVRGKVLVVDIGAGTTDLMLIDNATVIDASKDSLTIGGNQVSQSIKRFLRKKDLDLPDEEIQNAIVTGKAQDGAKVLNVVKVVQKFKRDTAKAEIQKLRDYFETSGVLPRTITHILICGGGSLGGETPELTPMSEMMQDYLKVLAPNSVMVEIPNDEAGKPISPRFLNLIGAVVITLINNK
jgi:hypothetical protein